MRNIIFIFILLILRSHVSEGFAKEKKGKKFSYHANTISLIDIYNTGPYQFNTNTPNIYTTGRHNNFGIAYSRQICTISRGYYLTAGLRLLRTTSEVEVRTKLPGFEPDISKFTFVPAYTHLSVPIYIGKEVPLPLYPRAELKIFAGGSIGLSKITDYAEAYTVTNAHNDSETIGVRYTPFTADVSKIAFSATIDAGFQFAPFGTPKVSIGGAISYNLLKTPAYKDNGAFGNRTQNLYDEFTVDFTRRFVNVLFSVNYSFGR